MNKIEEAYVNMQNEDSKSEAKTPQSIISEAKKEIANESDNDYLADPEIKDLVENYSKSDVIAIVTVLAKKLAS